MRKHKRVMLLAAGVALAVVSPAVAATYVPAVTVAGTAQNLANPPYTLGYEFSTSQTFSVGGLGVFDLGDDGLADAHNVGLWDSLGNLLASTTVQAGALSGLSSGFRFEALTPFDIGPGTYRVGALFLSGNDASFFPGTGTVTSLPGVTYLSGAYGDGGVLTDPVNTGGGAPSFIGGNVLLASASGVPEPATWITMILGFGLIGGGMRRTQQKVRVRYA